MIVFWMNCRLSAGNTWKRSRRTSMRWMKQVHAIWRMWGKSLKSWCRLSSALSSWSALLYRKQLPFSHGAWHRQRNLCRFQVFEKLHSFSNNSTCNSTLTLKCLKFSLLHWHVRKPKQNKRLQFSFHWSFSVTSFIQNARKTCSVTRSQMWKWSRYFYSRAFVPQ